MKTWITGGYIYRLDKKRMERKDLCIEDGKISGFFSPWEGARDGEIYDAKGKYVVPGFIDLHTHGGCGIDVNAASKEDFQKIGYFFAKQGTTTWLCSILTDTEERTIACIREVIAHKKENENCANLLGIHLEGPFLFSQYKGAMPEFLLKKPDMDLLERYQMEAEGNIRYITVSPEVEDIPQLIPQIREMGITVSVGHSGADYETSWKCIKQGARACTHTFNAMGLFHQHRPGLMGAVLESDIYCEAICDGKHLHPGTVRMLLKVKGYDRVAAVTDSIMAAGLPDGKYKLGVNDVVVEHGDAKLEATGVRAGSTLTTGQALINFMKFTGKDLEDILPLLTINPAKIIGEDSRIGSLEEGKDADVVILDQKYNVTDTFVKGNKIQKEGEKICR